MFLKKYLKRYVSHPPARVDIPLDNTFQPLMSSLIDSMVRLYICSYMNSWIELNTKDSRNLVFNSAFGS